MVLELDMSGLEGSRRQTAIMPRQRVQTRLRVPKVRRDQARKQLRECQCGVRREGGLAGLGEMDVYDLAATLDVDAIEDAATMGELSLGELGFFNKIKKLISRNKKTIGAIAGAVPGVGGAIAGAVAAIGGGGGGGGSSGQQGSAGTSLAPTNQTGTGFDWARDLIRVLPDLINPRRPEPAPPPPPPKPAISGATLAVGGVAVGLLLLVASRR